MSAPRAPFDGQRVDGPDDDGARLTRAAVVLGVAGLVSPLIALPPSGLYGFVRVKGAAIVVVVVLSLLAIVAGRTGRRPLVALAGAGFVVAALLQLVQFGRATNWLDGDGSTVSLLLGLGVGLLTLGLVPLPAPDGGTRAT